MKSKLPPVLAPVLRPLCMLNMPEMRSHRLRREFVTTYLARDQAPGWPQDDGNVHGDTEEVEPSGQARQGYGAGHSPLHYTANSV